MKTVIYVEIVMHSKEVFLNYHCHQFATSITQSRVKIT